MSEIDPLVDDFEVSRDRPTGLTVSTTAASVPADIASTVSRLEALYVKLWLSLRYTVRFAFAAHADVLEAGTFIQVNFY